MEHSLIVLLISRRCFNSKDKIKAKEFSFEVVAETARNSILFLIKRKFVHASYCIITFKIELLLEGYVCLGIKLSGSKSRRRKVVENRGDLLRGKS